MTTAPRLPSTTSDPPDGVSAAAPSQPAPAWTARTPGASRDGPGLAWNGPAGRPVGDAPMIELHDVTVRFGEVQALQRGEPGAAPRRPPGAGGVPTARARPRCCACCTAWCRFEGRREVVAINGRMPVIAMLFQRPFLLSLSVRCERAARAVAARRGAGRARTALPTRRCSAWASTRVARRSARSLGGGAAAAAGAGARLGAGTRHPAGLDEPTANLEPERQARSRGA